MSSRIALMRDGKIEQCGTPAEVYARPQSIFVANFLGGANFVSGTVAGNDGARLAITCADGRVLSAPMRDGIGKGQRVALMLRPECLHIEGAESAAPEGTRLDGTIERVIYEGNALLVQVGTSTGAAMTVRVATDGSGWALAPGSPVRLSWRFESGVVLPDA